VNATAGFSIVSYTGTGSNATVGHGLGVKPDVIIVKSRTQGTTGYTANWDVYTSASGATKYLYLNSNASLGDQANIWQDTEPTSSVFSIGTAAAVNTSSDSFIAYCFSSVEGYSRFWFYTGNGLANGPFVYTGFKPEFIIAKNTATTNSWRMWDNKVNPSNPVAKGFYPNGANAEDTAVNWTVDWLSNGFKVRNDDGEMNGSGQDIIFWAWAEAPFKYANAR